jgi:hypothetical protein
MWAYSGHVFEIDPAVTDEPIEATALILKWIGDQQAVIDASDARTRAVVDLAVAEMENPEATSPSNVAGTARKPIPDDVKLFVWRRDGGSGQLGSREALGAPGR